MINDYLDLIIIYEIIIDYMDLILFEYFKIVTQYCISYNIAHNT